VARAAPLRFELARVNRQQVKLIARAQRLRIDDDLNVARANAERTIALIDSTKFGRSSLLTIAQAQDMDAIVTDTDLDEGTAREYRAAGVNLEIATT